MGDGRAYRSVRRQSALGHADGTPCGGPLIVREDIDRFIEADSSIARGEFPSQCLESPVLRRFALEGRDRQADTITAAILETNPGINAMLARAHAAALVSVVQSVTDRIGRAILDVARRAEVASCLRDDSESAFADLGDHFRTLSSHSAAAGRTAYRDVRASAP